MHPKMYMIALALYLLTWVTAAYKPLNFSDMKADGGPASPIVLPITGNVYPLGYYTVAISIGNDDPPKYSYPLDVDTGSDLTWALCPDDYTKNVVTCGEDACKALGDLADVNTACVSPTDECKYRIDYADGDSSKGVLVRDSIPLTLGNGTKVFPQLTFGCETLGENEDPTIHQNIVGGILGLSNGEPGILKQLRKMGVINRNVVSHCFNGSGGGGYLYFGNLPNFEAASWVQMRSDADEHYHLGPADILLGGEATDITDLKIIFDSGSTFTALEIVSYEALLDLITKNLNGQLSSVVDGKKICWKDVKPIETIAQVASYFLPVTLNFTDANNALFEMRPESYLIINDQKNVCLGILNGTEFGLGDMNVIGDISMQNKMVMYDNDYGSVGWAEVETCMQQ